MLLWPELRNRSPNSTSSSVARAQEELAKVMDEGVVEAVWGGNKKENAPNASAVAEKLRPAKTAVRDACGVSVPEMEKEALRWKSMEDDM